MADLEVLKRAKIYMDKLANGINPIDNNPVDENDIVNNVRLSRCFFYVSDILRQVIENGGGIGRTNKKKDDFYISSEKLENYKYSNKSVPVSKIAERINELIDNNNIKKITYNHINEWLLSIDMLKIETKADGKTAKRPTKAGNDIGITTEERIGRNGKYIVTVYNIDAQHFIIDNIDAIIAVVNSK